jgi:hypothetical protein
MTMTPKVLGLDLSLTATGLAGNAGWTETLKPPTKLRDTDRLDWILRTITGNFLAGVDLAVVEGPAYSRQAGQAGHHERAGLWWLVRVTLAHRHIPTAVVTPSCLKRYATGRGVGSKDAIVLAAARRFGWFDGDNNAGDALFLAAMGTDHLGQPMVPMPAAHRAALAAVEWPEIPALERGGVHLARLPVRARPRASASVGGRPCLSP